MPSNVNMDKEFKLTWQHLNIPRFIAQEDPSDEGDEGSRLIAPESNLGIQEFSKLAYPLEIDIVMPRTLGEDQSNMMSIP